MAKKRAKSSIEAAMQERMRQAEAAVERKHPEHGSLLTSYFENRVIIDVQVGDEWIRYEHTVEHDLVAAEMADASMRRREVRHAPIREKLEEVA